MIKRDLWTNDEVIAILKLSLMGNSFGEKELDFSLDQAILRFYDFKAKDTEFGAMGFDIEKQLTVYVGPRLPQ